MNIDLSNRALVVLLYFAITFCCRTHSLLNRHGHLRQQRMTPSVRRRGPRLHAQQRSSGNDNHKEHSPWKRNRRDNRYGGNWRNKNNPRAPRKPGMTASRIFDVRLLKAGKIVEYENSKGSKRLVLINKRLGTYLEVKNEVNNTFTIPVKRVSYLVEGEFKFEDLRLLNDMILDLKPVDIERVYECVVSEKTTKLPEDAAEIASLSNATVAFTLEYISNLLYSTPVQDQRLVNLSDNITIESGRDNASRSALVTHLDIHRASQEQRLYAAFQLMSMYGDVFFDMKDTDSLQEGSRVHGLGLVPIAAAATNKNNVLVYVPLEKEQVNINIKHAAALREFRARFRKFMESPTTTNKNNKSNGRGSPHGETETENTGSKKPWSTDAIDSDIPERVAQVLHSYGPGLKQIAIERHPWVQNGLARLDVNAAEADKGRKVLNFLGLAPNAKNARKVLEVAGIWKPYENVEKYVMQIRDKFPADVIAEATYLVENSDILEDMDARIRRDLRHLGAYAIDREGAAEVDDAVSIEFLDNGKEKLWIHIADVSHWVRPGSRLSLEAERRMTSIYMPDQRISMFPEVLTTELLSLGAKKDSYALSCGVILSDKGEVESYEVCPSRIRMSRRLSYAELDEVLSESMVSDGNIVSSNSVEKGLYSTESDSSKGFIEERESGRHGSSTTSGGIHFNDSIRRDLTRLYHWALLRNRKRIKDGALDEMLRHKTELFLVVRERDVAAGSITNQNDQRVAESLWNANQSANKGGLRRWGEGPAGKRRIDSHNALNRVKVVVNGYMSWSNASSVSLVSEYMVLMCQVMGAMCKTNEIPVWYKVQSPHPPLRAEDLQVRSDENLVLRSARILSHLRSANDSKVPGEHVTTGSSEYVQCTSPIRRYHDLYNHYRLKAAMHAASLGPDYENRAKEEAGITMLDRMATAEERLQTLIACTRVVRHREQYWLRIYIEKLCSTRPRLSFDCMVMRSRGIYTDALWQNASFTNHASFMASKGYNSPGGNNSPGYTKKRNNGIKSVFSEPMEGSRSTHPHGVIQKDTDKASGYISEALIFQLGSFKVYPVFHRKPLSKGELVKCHLLRQYTNPVTHALIPVDEIIAEVPEYITNQLLSAKEKTMAASLN